MMNKFSGLNQLSKTITELQIAYTQVEAQDRYRNELLKAVIGAIPSIIFYLDKDLKIIWANPAAAKEISSTREGLIGKYCYQAMGWKDECEQCPARITVKYNCPQTSEVTKGDRTFEVSTGLVRSNGFSGVVAVHRDISHRKRNAEMVKQYYQRAEALCEASTEGIVIHRDNEVLIVNKAFTGMVGYSEAELKQNKGLQIKERLMWKIIAPEYREMVKKKIQNNDMELYDVEYITKSGEKISVSVQPGEVEYNNKGLCRVAIVTLRGGEDNA